MDRSIRHNNENGAGSIHDQTVTRKEGMSANMITSHNKVFTISILIPPKPDGINANSRPSSPTNFGGSGNRYYAEGPCTIGTFQVIETSSQGASAPTKAEHRASTLSNEVSSSATSLTQHDELAGSTLPFVWKLHEMLEDMEQTSREEIVSWVDGGRAFKVHKMTEFVNTIIPMYFKQSKFRSFQRQLVRSHDHVWVRVVHAKSFSPPNVVLFYMPILVAVPLRVPTSKSWTSCRCVQECQLSKGGQGSVSVDNAKEQRRPKTKD